jgi:hypothetical protein
MFSPPASPAWAAFARGPRIVGRLAGWAASAGARRARLGRLVQVGPRDWFPFFLRFKNCFYNLGFELNFDEL